MDEDEGMEEISVLHSVHVKSMNRLMKMKTSQLLHLVGGSRGEFEERKTGIYSVNKFNKALS